MKLYQLALTLPAFLACACASPAPAPGPSGNGGISERVMSRYDLDRDGRITPEETDTVRKMRFERMDLDADGVLSPSEAEALRQEAGNAGGGRMAQRRGDPVSRLDTDGDGNITAEEFQGVDSELLNRADQNGDGVIERWEIDALAERFRSRRG